MLSQRPWPLLTALYAAALLGSLVTRSSQAAELPWITLAADKQGFVSGTPPTPFVPWGFNYDHEEDGKLLEDYWDEEWPTVVSAFEEMKDLGANVVRIHLQFGKFMKTPHQPRQPALQQLARLVRLAERTEIYLNVTGLGCYHKQDVPDWYDQLDEQDRWASQVVFWQVVAKVCANSPAIFCYDLMNEPVVPGGNQPRKDWLGPAFGDKHFVQFISLARDNRDRTAIARRWIRTLAEAIRKNDPRHLITVGLVPWSLERPGLTSGFSPTKIAPELDFLSVHIYPEKNKVAAAVETVKSFAAAGKPVVIEETFPLKCNPNELEQFIDQSRPYAAGWIGFYWGQPPSELRPPKTIPQAFILRWLELFQRKTPQIAAPSHEQRR